MPDLHRYQVKLRAELDGNVLHGAATVFGEIADVPEGYERFDTGAFDKLLADKENDTAALWNHNPDHLLGRTTSGTLRLRASDEGLLFELDLPDTQIGRDLKVLAARGDLQGASVGFLSDGERFEKAPDGRPIRVYTNVARLRDISPVSFPAYAGTKGTIALRSAEFGRPTRARSQLIRARARVHLKGVRT